MPRTPEKERYGITRRQDEQGAARGNASEPGIERLPSAALQGAQQAVSAAGFSYGKRTSRTWISNMCRCC